jgi:hypothetical protein
MKVLERFLPEQIILRNPNYQWLHVRDLVSVRKVACISVQNHQPELLRILLVRMLSHDPVTKSGGVPVFQREDDATSGTKALQDLR